MFSRIKKLKKLWHRLSNGILVPNGYVSDHSRSGTDTYLEIKQKAQFVESFYADFGMEIPRECGLGYVIKCAKELSDAWLIDGAESVSDEVLYGAAHLNRVSEGILALRDQYDPVPYLRKLINGSLDFLDREQSEAKNFLWELELLRSLHEHGVNANLVEPPDIVCEFEGSSIGIACKKIYSEGNVEKVLSQGVAQIEDKYEFGIIAINIDNLTPAGTILVVDTQEEMADRVSDLNKDFLRRHERHFRRYLTSGRLLSALISTNVLADFRGERVRLNNARQSTVWTIPGLSVEKEQTLRRFYNQIME